MVGERYFAARERLLGCIGRIDALGEDVSLAPAQDKDGDDARALASLRSPLRVVALGEVNAGKSTLFNAFAGTDLCETGPLPTTKRTVIYRYGRAEAERELKGGWLELRKPWDFLKRIELIDTPGSNSDQREQIIADCGRFNKADLILVVFPAANTWTAASWDLVSALSDDALERTLLVIQQAEEKSAEDLRVIEGHMRDLSTKKVGHELPILAMSAQMAYEAKTSPETARKGWSASRFATFEDWFTQEVCDSPMRRHVIDRSFQEAARTLRGIEDMIDRQRREMDDDGWFLAGLEREANQLRDLLVDDAPRTITTQDEGYQKLMKTTGRSLLFRLSALRSLWNLLFGDSTPSQVEADFAERMQGVIGEFAAKDANRLLAECEGHWGTVRPRVVDRMGLDPGDSVISGEAHDKAVERMVEVMRRSVPSVLDRLRIRASLDAPLRDRNRRLKGFVTVLLVQLIVTGVCGTLGWNDLASGLLMGAAVWAVMTFLVSWVSARRIARDTVERLTDSSAQFEEAVRQKYVEAVRGLFAEYSGGLIAVRRRLAKRQHEIDPLSKRWDDLYLELKMAEQEMG